MLQGIEYSVTLVLLLLLFNVAISSLCGFGTSGESGKVIEGCLIIFLLYSVIVELFGENLNVAGIPFLDALEDYGSLINLYHNDLGRFVLECAELISFTFVFNYISNLLPGSFGGSSYTGKFIRCVVVVLIGVFVNHYFVTALSQTIFFPWAKQALQCFFAGTAMVLTPAMILGGLLRMSSNNPFILFLVEKLPQTKIGKSVSTATTNSLVWLGVTMIFESQFGSAGYVIGQLPGLIELIGPIAISFFGIRLMLKVVTS